MQKKYTPMEWSLMEGGHSLPETELTFIQSLGEARMFRGKSQIAGEGARSISDHTFVSLMSLYTMSQDYDYAPVAKEYAKRTRALGNFNNPSPGGTDLYQSIFSLQRPELMPGDKSQLLMNKVNVDTPRIKRFLDKIRTGTASNSDAQQFFFKLERDLKIQDPKLKAARRLVQNWDNLGTQQRQLVGSQLMRYYRMDARRSDLMPLFAKYSKDANLELNNDEKKSIAQRVARGAGLFAAGYALSKLTKG